MTVIVDLHVSIVGILKRTQRGKQRAAAAERGLAQVRPTFGRERKREECERGLQGKEKEEG
jgi:hypothetical protein